jgi:hypothetical protein
MHTGVEGMPRYSSVLAMAQKAPVVLLLAWLAALVLRRQARHRKR